MTTQAFLLEATRRILATNKLRTGELYTRQVWRGDVEGYEIQINCASAPQADIVHILVSKAIKPFFNRVPIEVIVNVPHTPTPYSLVE